MVAWSSIGLRALANVNLCRNVIASSKSGSFKKAINYVPVRSSGDHRTLIIRTSKYNWTKFKDLLIFYTLLGVIPLFMLITYVNVFIGDAQLAVIPEGYEPKHWEYHRHPISRFIAKYCVLNPQEVYERNLHHLYKASEKKEIKALENKIHDLMSEREDYQSWYYYPTPAVKYGRKTKEIFDETEFSKRGRSSTNVYP